MPETTAARTSDLIRRVQQAKARRQERDVAYTEIVRRFQDMAFGSAFALLEDVQHAEDAAQEAFMDAWARLQDLRDPDAFPGWFRRIVQTRCHRRLRRKGVPTASMEAAANARDPEPSALATVEAQEASLLVRQSLRSLPEDDRILLVLFHLDEYSYRQIATFLELTPSTVDNRLRAARRKLKERMSAMTADELRSNRPSRDGRFVDEAMARPPELDGDTWRILSAANDGDTDTVRAMLADDPKLLTVNYGYWQPLHFAARAGRTDIVELLLDAGADPLSHVWWAGYHNPLEAARDRGHEQSVRLLEAAVNSRTQGAATRGELICHAVASGDASRIGKLLDEDPSLVNVAEIVSDQIGSRQPLHVAVEMGRLDLVDLLVERGADLEGVRGDGFKPIHVALWENQWRKVRDGWAMVGYLLGKGAQHSICVAAARNDRATVSRLLDEDAALVNFRDTNGVRPLSCAAERHHEDMTRLLLERGADPNLPEDNYAHLGYALWSVTCGRPNSAIARLLLEAGASIKAGWHASGDVSYALVTAKDDELRGLLYEHGAVAGLSSAANAGRLDLCAEILAVDPSKAQDHLYGNAIQQGHLGIVKLMMRHGAQLDPKMVRTWQTALAQCLAHQRVELAEFLIENGEDINWPNWFGQPPLHYATMRDRPDMVEWALDHGADIEARDWELESRTLAWAAHVGSIECARVLLERGAKVTHPEDKPWNTPMARAEKTGHAEIAALLRQHVQ
jgi:RNA polymerase sigma factor (sigma-70 family)